MLKTVAVLLGVLALSACANMNRGTDAAAGIAVSVAQFETAFNAGDAAAVAALYTEDGVVLPPDAARIDGREGIQELWQGFMDAGAEDLILETVEIIGGGRGMATEVGRFSLTLPDGQGGRTMAYGKFIVLWVKGQDGTWRLHRDIWNAAG